MEILFGDIETRDKVFIQLLELFDYEVGFDWFHEYFQEEHAERKSRKQDFTPESIAKILTRIVNDKDQQSIYEPTAGTGGILITNWNDKRMQTNPFSYRPSNYICLAEELGDRTMPFLLLNLIVRGMNAIVIHGDTITRESYGAFFIQNDHDDHFKFSSLNTLPYNENTESLLNIKFIEEKYTQIKQTEGVPMVLADNDQHKKLVQEDNELFSFISGLCNEIKE